MLSTDQIAMVKRARLTGYMNQTIAAYLDENQGRIAEVNTGQVGASVPPADALPLDFPPLLKRGRCGGGLPPRRTSDRNELPDQPGLF